MEQSKLLAPNTNFLRLSNTILVISVIIGMGFIFLFRQENTKLQKEKAELKLEVQTLMGSLAGPPSAQVGDIVPAFEGSNLDGRQIRIAYDGSTSYLLYIFSPTCSACLSQFPIWKQSVNKAKSTNRVTLGLSTNSKEATQAVIDTATPNFEIVLIPSISIQRAYRVVAEPMTMLVSPRGQVEWVYYGALTEDKLLELSALLDANAGPK